ncbi:MAG: glycosyltransferase [Rhodospirillales bacterium]
MNVLFVHRFFPGQFEQTAKALAVDAGNHVVFVHEKGSERIRGVENVQIHTKGASPSTHHYLQSLEAAVRLGQAAYLACRGLARQGFRPDLVCAHAGFGPGLYVKDAFPEIPVLGYFEWYYHALGADAGFFDPSEVSEDDRLRIRTRNAGILLELAHCDRAICPTLFQKQQFPLEFADKLQILHDGIDTVRFQPRPAERRSLISELCLPDDAEILTYAARGLEPYRGFTPFMAALAKLQPMRPRLHAVIVGADRAYYGKRLPDGDSYVDLVRRQLPDLDWRRIHLTGPLPMEAYRRVLQASDVHVYLTVPFVLSWSLLEAMAVGCSIVGSATKSVEEVIVHGDTGLLADLRSPADIAAQISVLLDDASLRHHVGARARKLIEDRYALAKLLPMHLDVCRQMAAEATKPGK